MDGLKISIDEVKKDIYTRLDDKLPETTMREIQLKLKKERDVARIVEALSTRMSNVENSVSKILQNQDTRAQLLQQLVAAQTSTLILQLDDNKTGEKDVHVHVSKLIVLSITMPSH